MAFSDWSTTAGSNTAVGGVSIAEGMNPSDVNNAIRAVMADGRAALGTKGADIASATTTDLGAVAGLFHDITGTTTITGFGTIGAGIWKVIKFEGALTLTHNSTSLIIPGGLNITTADGDIAVVYSEGSGNWRVVSYTKAGGLPVMGTAAASTSGTSIDFTGIPSGTKQIIISLVGVSTNGTSGYVLQLGDAGGVEATGYTGAVTALTTAPSINMANHSTYFAISGTQVAAATYDCQIHLALEKASSFTWTMSSQLVRTDTTGTTAISCGAKSTSALLDRVRITTANGTDTFDAGEINIQYI